MERKVNAQRILYRVLFILSVIFSIGGAGLNFYLYNNCYEYELGVMTKGAPLTVYYIVGGVIIAAVIAIVALPIFRCASSKLPVTSGGTILANSFCGFFLIAYVVLLIFEYRDNGMSIPAWLWVMAFSAIVGSLYFHYQTLSSRPNKATISIFGMFLMIFTVVNVYAVHYTATGVLINSPVKIGSMLAMTACLMFIVSEVRYYFGIAIPKSYFAFALATGYFCLSDSVVKIYLSVTEGMGFTTNANTLLLAYEMFVAVYAILRMAGYLKKDMFKDEIVVTKELYDDEIVEIKEYKNEKDNFENPESVSVDDDVKIYPAKLRDFEPVIDVETTEADEFGDDKSVVAEENAEEEKAVDMTMLTFSGDDEDDNDLPDEPGFEGGHEGEFEIEGFATVESASSELDDDEDEDDDEEMHPFSALGIDENEIDHLMAAEGEMIDYEELKSASINNEVEEDDGEEEDNEIDIMTLFLDHEGDDSENQQSTVAVASQTDDIGEAPGEFEKNTGVKSYSQRFKFVKKTVKKNNSK